MSIVEQVREIVATSGNLVDFKDGDDLVDKGCDSLSAAEILSQIELRYGVGVAAEYFEKPTVENLVSSIEAKRLSARS